MKAVNNLVKEITESTNNMIHQTCEILDEDKELINRNTQLKNEAAEIEMAKKFELFRNQMA